MSTNVKKRLTKRQLAAVEKLMAGANYTDAAAAAGVTVRTLARWREEQYFQDELRKHTTEATERAARRLAHGMDSMLSILEELANDEDTTQSVRFRSSVAWLDRTIQLVELADVLQRLEALEAVVR